MALFIFTKIYDCLLLLMTKPSKQASKKNHVVDDGEFGCEFTNYHQLQEKEEDGVAVRC